MRNSSVSVLNVITPRLSREFQYGPRRAAYDLKKLRGKHIVARIGKTPRYEAIPEDLKAMAALIMLREKPINADHWLKRGSRSSPPEGSRGIARTSRAKS